MNENEISKMNDLAKKIDAVLPDEITVTDLAIAMSQLLREKYSLHNLETFEDTLADELRTEIIKRDE
tara:strand:- start:298 stop:498 length:201 start_codon:yes stop_codon:yes gene_type:complete